MKFMKYNLVHSVNKYAPVTGTDFGFAVIKYDDYVMLEAELADRVIAAGGPDNYALVEDFDVDSVIAQEPAFLGASLTWERVERIKEQYLDILDPDLLLDSPENPKEDETEEVEEQSVLDVAAFDFEDDVDPNEHAVVTKEAEDEEDLDGLAELVELAELLVEDSNVDVAEVVAEEVVLETPKPPVVETQPFTRTRGGRQAKSDNGK